MKPTKKQPLFIITGASCSGKSTSSEILFKKEENYIVMESDILWNGIYNTPENNYFEYRKLWLSLCANISQIGKPVVLCGCATPEQCEACPEKEFFDGIHYAAIVCDGGVLESRMRNGRKVTDENWIKSSLEFNDWIRNNASKNNIHVIDNSKLSPAECAAAIDDWIMGLL